MAEKTVHLIQVNADRTITVPAPIILAKNSVGVDTLRVIFLDGCDWEGLTYYVSFNAAWLDDAASFAWDGVSDIDIPAQATDGVGFVNFGIAGVNAQEQRAYSIIHPKTIQVVLGGFIDGVVPEYEPTAMDTLLTAAARVEAAVSSASGAATAASSAATAANTAAAKADAAAESAAEAVETAAADVVPQAVAEAVESYVGALAALSVVDGELCVTYTLNE